MRSTIRLTCSEFWWLIEMEVKFGGDISTGKVREKLGIFEKEC